MVPLTVFIVISCSLPFCGGINSPSEKFVTAINSFSINFYKKLPDRERNILASPFSVAMSLAMVLLGAHGNTEKEIKDTLLLSKQGLTRQELLDACKTLITAIKQIHKSVQFVVANSLWLQEGTIVFPNYTSTLADVFQSEQHFVDFKSSNSKEKINEWVAETTNKKIKKLFTKPLDSETKLALVNAIYFNGKWFKQFDTMMTQDRPFLNFGSKTKLVPIMQERSDRPYIVSDHLSAQVVQLDYDGNDVSMVLILPAEAITLQSVESKLNLVVLNNLLSNLSDSSSEVLVFLPKFKVEMTLQLKDILTGLGINDVFHKNSDLSGIIGKRNLKISEAVQKSVLQADEKGTEAASATETVMTLLSLPDIVFNANRPFIYIIKHNPTNAIIFMGKIVVL